MPKEQGDATGAAMTGVGLARPQGRLKGAPPSIGAAAARHWPLLLGLATMVIPTMIRVAHDSWSTEQGAHGPIVVATGVWLVMTLRRDFMPLIRPGRLGLSLAALAVMLPLYALARLTGTTEVEGIALYFTLIAVAYAYLGSAAMRVLWFPILYFAFVFPPPDTMVALITQPLKIGISKWSVDLLALLGYPVARSGVMIQIDQYDILVAAACAGLNSLISLSAISLFYIYLLHKANWRYALVLMLAVVPVAALANFVRVVLIILLTYYGGDALAQGFLHGFAGLTLFTVALLGIFGIDKLLTPLRRRLAARDAAA